MKVDNIKYDLSRFGELSANLMEVCGTHTMAFSRYGMYDMLPKDVRLLSGPGCPVCVTDGGFISTAIGLGREKDVIITTFGDMLRVPSRCGCLELVRAEGADVRVVYSPHQSVDIAQANPKKRVVFLAVGFETTIPTVALSILASRELKNHYFLTALRLIPPALNIIGSRKESRINGFILPGHVSVIIGRMAYEKIAERYKIPSVISGFNANDLMSSLSILLSMIKEKRNEVVNNYERVVTDVGNKRAQEVMEECFDVVDIKWRGLGVIEKSGMGLKADLSHLDARKAFETEITEEDEPEGCACGDVLAGLITPPECSLFSVVCSPDDPIGPCMVSSEGACAAYFKYGRL